MCVYRRPFGVGPPWKCNQQFTTQAECKCHEFGGWRRTGGDHPPWRCGRQCGHDCNRSSTGFGVGPPWKGNRMWGKDVSSNCPFSDKGQGPPFARPSWACKRGPNAPSCGMTSYSSPSCVGWGGHHGSEHHHGNGNDPGHGCGGHHGSGHHHGYGWGGHNGY